MTGGLIEGPLFHAKPMVVGSGMQTITALAVYFLLRLTNQPITTMRKKKHNAAYNSQLNSVLGISSDNNFIKSMAISLWMDFASLICGKSRVVNQRRSALPQRMLLLYICLHDIH
jgi:hypothetical protein